MTRGELRTAVLDALNRKDLNSAANLWITSATSKINTALRHRKMLQHRILDVTASKFATPLDFIEADSFKINKEPGEGLITPGADRGVLEYCPPSEITDKSSAVFASNTRRPMFYTTHGMTFELAPWVSTAEFQADLWYYAKVKLDAADDATNFVLSEYPQLYMNYAMAFGHRFLLENDTGNGYEALAAGEIDQINEMEKMAKIGNGPLIIRPRTRIGGRFS